MRLRYELPRHFFAGRYTHFTDSAMESLAEQMEGSPLTFKDQEAGQILSADYHAQDEIMDVVIHVPDGSELTNLLTTQMFKDISMKDLNGRS
jgi:hypothetical protein